MRLFANNTKKPTDADAPTQGGAAVVELAPGLCNLYSPDIAEPARVRDLADVLLEMGKISDKQYEQLRQDQTKRRGSDLDKLARHLGLGDDVLLEAKARLYGFEFRRLTADKVDREAFETLPLDYIKTNRVLPLAFADDRLVVATCDPANVFVIDDVKRQTGRAVEVVVCTAADIEAVCDALDESKFDFDEELEDIEDLEVVQEAVEDVADLERTAGTSPVIQFVNQLLVRAMHEGASDIHIEPKEKCTKIRFRIDGMLFDAKTAPVKMHPAIVSRLKIMANLDISERRLPQDGKIHVRIGGRTVDLRVSVLPVTQGEKVVVRILDSSSILRGLDNSGMEADIIKEFREQIALPHGIFLVTGPTGSGKSTTLYSALAELKSDHLNISTVEDPVEYDLEFCNQVQVHEQIGMTFAAALRSLLRQDPDIIMVGEIRDQETARIAVQAALTGHLVLSTLHTNDAPSSVSRLVNIGIEPYLIAASLNGILAQRLVRRICPNCKEAYRPPKAMAKTLEAAGLDPTKLVHGKGCDQCRDSGYAGRAGIFELLVVDDYFREIINRDPSVNGMREAFRKSGADTLYEDGLKKVRQGVTTIEEVLRVTEATTQDADGDARRRSTAAAATPAPKKTTKSRTARSKTARTADDSNDDTLLEN